MKAITYSISNNGVNSQAYYNEARKFAGEVMDHAAEFIIPAVEEYMEYLRAFKLEELRELEEYVLELLSFGVLWHSYSRKALEVKIAPFIILSKMAEWRKKHQRAKPMIDFTRGILMTLLMLPENSKEEFIEIPTLDQIDHVCKWFEATGEFREQALRFIRWRAFWGTKDFGELAEIFSAINVFTIWFEKRSEQVLGKYTENVESFLESSGTNYRWREDRIQCTRSRLEYHLNMVGAELMNRAFRRDFKRAEERVILVPGCMRAKPPEECEAVKMKEGLVCSDCDRKCRVNQLKMMGRKHNFGVYIIPHASDLSLWSPREGRPLRGVIASACVTTLVEGGWELKRYDVPAQCVLLDYCGCSKHWCSEGIPTKFNMGEFKRILNN